MALTTKRNAPGRTRPAPELRGSDRSDPTRRLDRDDFSSVSPARTPAAAQRVHCWVAWMAIFGMAGAWSMEQAAAGVGCGWWAGCKGCRTLGTCQCNREQCNARNLFLLHCTCVALGFRRVGLAGVEHRLGWGRSSSWPCGVLVRSRLSGFTRQVWALFGCAM